MQLRDFAVVVAATLNDGIGLRNSIPWRISSDMRYFSALTSKVQNGAGWRNAVILGRVTYDSLPAKFRPLPNRLNVVLTRNPSAVFPEGVLSAQGLDDALKLIALEDKIERVFVIGGTSVYEPALQSPHCRQIYMTRVMTDKVECDTFFPKIDPAVYELQSVKDEDKGEENGLKYEFQVFNRKVE